GGPAGCWRSGPAPPPAPRNRAGRARSRAPRRPPRRSAGRPPRRRPRRAPCPPSALPGRERGRRSSGRGLAVPLAGRTVRAGVGTGEELLLLALQLGHLVVDLPVQLGGGELDRPAGGGLGGA